MSAASGQSIAMQSGLATRPDDYTVTLLNSNVNNAFAIPGGYVYVTRQLVALMNDEAELAFVLGHEVAHVAARHADKRSQRSTFAEHSAPAIAVRSPDPACIGDLAGTGAQLYTLNYSRDQETEADTLGVRYLARAGYDPAAGADILGVARRPDPPRRHNWPGQGGREPRQWLSTHPANAERVAQVRRDAAAIASATGRATNRDAFLDAIDGMAYDDDPAQGSVDGPRFRHAALGIAFDAPAGFALQNSPSAVTGTKNGAGRFTFGGGRGTDLQGYATNVWQGLGVRTPQLRARRINGIDALIGELRVQRSGRAVDASVVTYQWGPGNFYHIVMLAPANGLPAFGPLIESVRRLEPAAATGGRRIKVVRVAKGDTVASLAARMAYNDDKLARFTILNGITATTPLVPGSRVKLVVTG